MIVTSDKQSGKTFLKLSRSEWEAIGQKNNWIVANKGATKEDEKEMLAIEQTIKESIAGLSPQGKDALQILRGLDPQDKKTLQILRGLGAKDADILRHIQRLELELSMTFSRPILRNVMKKMGPPPKM